MKYLLAFLLIILGALPAHAATLYLTAQPSAVGRGDVVNVSVYLDSAQSVNAYAGVLTYSSDYLEPLSVSDGNSLVSNWITHPATTSAGSLSFAGVTPGGFIGTRGLLFSILFKAKQKGMASLAVLNPQILRNDGAGSPELTPGASSTLVIAAYSKGGYVIPVDTTVPEEFTPSTLWGPDNHYYAVFGVVDKGSGVVYYQVAEQRFFFIPVRWVAATSPYLLRDQYGTSDIYIKAVDNAGNDRTEVLRRANFLRPYELWGLIGIGIVCILCIVLVHWLPKKHGA